MVTTKKHINALTYNVVGCAIEVHKHLGPGLLEIMYERALCHELTCRGLRFERQKSFGVTYKGIPLYADLKYDILVEGLLLLEIKAVSQMHPIFDAQLLTYMQQCSVPKGLLINFHVLNLYHEGVKTMVNKLFAALPDE